MGKYARVKKDFSRLEQLAKELGRKYSVKVGILGQKASAKHTDGQGGTGNKTNSEIGFKHEFGSRSEKIPKRSFLREPLRFHLQEEVNKGAKKIMACFEARDIKKAYALLGIAAEAVIQKAFASRGFGLWKPNAPLTIAKKGSDSPLIDTGQLRKSVTSAVVEKA